LQADGPLSHISSGISLQGQWSLLPPTQKRGPLQLLLAHSLELEQGWPFFFLHWLPVHVRVLPQLCTLVSVQVPPEQRPSTTSVVPLHLRGEQAIPSLMAMETQTGEPVSQEIWLFLHMSLVPQAPPGTQAAAQVPALHV
jgi:hypothetical protein